MSLDWHLDRLAMQKVVGSSPIIRSSKGPGNGPFTLGERLQLFQHARHGEWPLPEHKNSKQNDSFGASILRAFLGEPLANCRTKQVVDPGGEHRVSAALMRMGGWGHSR
jgi:hypothetical protein